MKRLVWFRGKDLRVDDHGPLHDAQEAAACVFVLDPYFFAPDRAQRMANRIAFLLESLQELQHTISALGGQLIVVAGRSQEVIPRLARQLGVDEVVAHRWTEPFARARDQQVASALDVPFRLYEGETLLPPGQVRTGKDRPYAVFTPYSRMFGKVFEPCPPLPAPARIRSIRAPVDLKSVPIPTPDELNLTTSPQRLCGGEGAAKERLERFIGDRMQQYDTGRDQMGLSGTSRLSQDLKFGTVSVRTVWHRVLSEVDPHPSREAFLRQLIWREFSHSCLWHRPSLLETPFRDAWRDFPWADNDEGWGKWTTGQTGYPIVDASARELLATGFVHNRARMVSASFLTKHLRIDFRRGEAHYMAHLTGGDWAQNTAGWQWAAGCGCDAQPYFRVFNPMRQGERFDPEGDYVRKWVPELSKLSNRYIHAPWTAPKDCLDAAGLVLGETYPHPVVDHATARNEYLEVTRNFLRS
jgi:deoxyribodipyrimidine photo-lyase